MRINNNLMAMNTHRQLGVANTEGAKSMEKLSSGFRINRAGDDAAGLAISEKMRGQIRGLSQASSNAQDGISLIQTAEGALNETHAILQRMRELSVQSATDTNTDADRTNIQDEIDELTAEISRISETTEFNTMELLDGSYGNKKFHIGANKDQNIEFEIGDMGSDALGLMTEEFGGELDGLKISNGREKVTIETVGSETEIDNEKNQSLSVERDKDGKITINLATDEDGKITTTKNELKSELEKLGYKVEGGSDDVITKGEDVDLAATDEKVALNVSTQSSADKAIKTVDGALENVSKQRSKLGAVQNRLEHTIKNLDTSAENLQASESRIRDVDMAKEMMEQTKQNILQQASTAMLAQANMAPQSVLQLLG